MRDQLFIPEKLKVGYQKRSDTYTSNLGFVTYFDSKGEIRQPKAWEGWRNQEIEPKEFNNNPTEGFVVNRDVGGVRRSWSHYGRMEKVRVFDPRDFEIEITVENLLYILQECTSIKGKGLDGQFVYAWKDKQLVLLPSTSQEYQASLEYTSLQSQKVGAKELVPGTMYLTKKQDELMYLGRFDFHTYGYRRRKLEEPKRNNYGWSHYDDYWDTFNGPSKEKQYIFVDKEGNLTLMKALTSIAKQMSDVVSDQFAEMSTRFAKSKFASKLVNFKSVPGQVTLQQNQYYSGDKMDAKGHYFEKINDTSYFQYQISTEMQYNVFDQVTHRWDVTLKGYRVSVHYKSVFNDLEWRNEHLDDNVLRHINPAQYAANKTNALISKERLLEMQFDRIYAVLENGKEFELYDYMTGTHKI